MEVLRFTTVAVAGVILDIAVAFLLARYVGLPLWLSAVAGFASAMLANYAAHELWTFRTSARRFSLQRAVQYAAASMVTLLTRLLAIAVLGRLTGTGHILSILITAAGVSFIVNYLISKFLIFRRTLRKAGDA